MQNSYPPFYAVVYIIGFEGRAIRGLQRKVVVVKYRRGVLEWCKSALQSTHHHAIIPAQLELSHILEAE